MDLDPQTKKHQAKTLYKNNDFNAATTPKLTRRKNGEWSKVTFWEQFMHFYSVSLAPKTRKKQKTRFVTPLAF